MKFKQFLNEANASNEYMDYISNITVEYLSDEEDDGEVEISIEAEFYSDGFNEFDPNDVKEWKSAAKKIGIHIQKGESVDVKDDTVKFGKFKMNINDVEDLIDKLENYSNVDVVNF